MENTEELQTADAQEAASSAQQTVQETETTAETEAQATAPAETKQETPFHEHPRFKELVEQKNRYAEEAKAIKEQLAEMQKRFEAQSQPKVTENPLLTRLKGIDPEFAEFIDKLNTRAQKVEELESRLARHDQEQLRSKAATELDRLHVENKVPEKMREFYNSQIELAAIRNPQLGLKDLPGLYKQVHEKYSQVLEETKRAERESYVASKKADAKVPASQPKGQTVKPGQPTPKGDPHSRKQNIVQETMKALRSERKELGSH